MEEQIFFLNMFPDYEPPEELYAALSQAAIAAADIDPETRSVHVALHSERYIPQRLLEQVRKDICGLYGLQKLELTATHPESELQKIEPEELMWLFVSRNSMATVNAVLSANLVLSGFDPYIPLDQAISAMASVGRLMAEEHRCTGRGGLCTTTAGQCAEQYWQQCCAKT